MGIAEHPLFRFFEMHEAGELRLICTEFHHFVTETQWDDVRPEQVRAVHDEPTERATIKSPLLENIPRWRASFPNAIGVRIAGSAPLTDAILALLSGIPRLDLSWEHPSIEYTRRTGRMWRAPSVDPEDQSWITDEGFQFLRGIQWLDLSGRELGYATDAGFAHLRGIEHLYLERARLSHISPRGFLQLRGITTLRVCEYINPLWQCIHRGDYDAAIHMIGTVDPMWTLADDDDNVFLAASASKNEALIRALLEHGIRAPLHKLYDEATSVLVRGFGFSIE
jgi:hypothetical protein